MLIDDYHFFWLVASLAAVLVTLPLTFRLHPMRCLDHQQGNIIQYRLSFTTPFHLVCPRRHADVVVLHVMPLATSFYSHRHGSCIGVCAEPPKSMDFDVSAQQVKHFDVNAAVALSDVIEHVPPPAQLLNTQCNFGTRYCRHLRSNEFLQHPLRFENVGSIPSRIRTFDSLQTSLCCGITNPPRLIYYLTLLLLALRLRPR